MSLGSGSLARRYRPGSAQTRTNQVSSSPRPCLRVPCPALARPRSQLGPTHQRPAPRTRVRRWPHPADRPNPHARPVFPGRATPAQQQPRPRITPGSRPVLPAEIPGALLFRPRPFPTAPILPHHSRQQTLTLLASLCAGAASLRRRGLTATLQRKLPCARNIFATVR